MRGCKAANASQKCVSLSFCVEVEFPLRPPLHINAPFCDDEDQASANYGEENA
jgi:hypothetical protein